MKPNIIDCEFHGANNLDLFALCLSGSPRRRPIAERSCFFFLQQRPLFRFALSSVVGEKNTNRTKQQQKKMAVSGLASAKVSHRVSDGGCPERRYRIPPKVIST